MIKIELDPKKVADFVLWMEENRQKLLDSIPTPRCILIPVDSVKLNDTGLLMSSIPRKPIKPVVKATGVRYVGIMHAWRNIYLVIQYRRQDG